MERILAKDIPRSIGKKISIRGWINNVRALGKLTFVIMRDRTGLVQVVVQEPTEVKKIAKLQPGSILQVIGTVAASQSELGCELLQPSITVEVAIDTPPPLEYYKPEIHTDLEHILDHRSVALRNRKIQAVFTIQAEIAHAYRVYMHDVVQAVEYFPPNIIGASSEGGAEFFNVDYFNYTATLAQSSQLYKQIMVGVNERVFALAPFFRAENSHTPRHLTEGKQLEFEMGFFDDWHEVLDVQEKVLKFIVKTVMQNCKEALASLGGRFVKAPEEVPFPRITFKEALELYYKRTGVDERGEPDLSPSAERELCKYAEETFGTDFLFVVDWLTTKRPFYSYPKGDEAHLTNTFDLLCAGTEITSGGQRRHTYESMLEGLKEKGMDPAHFTDYLNIFKFGMPPHGGFGMGLERLTMTMLGLKNIREASLFPSDPKRIAGNRIKAKVFFGGENIRNEIIRLLRQEEVEFTHLPHGSEEKEGEAIKALLLKGKNSKKNYQFNLPVRLKVDMKAVAELVQEKCEFEDPEVIKERFGLIVGGVPPFGQLLNVETFFDQSIKGIDKVCFNCGLPTESIVMKGDELLSIVQAKIASFSKE